MDNALMVGLSRQLTLRRAMDVTANNVANMSTAGFRVERPLFATTTERPAAHQDGPRDISFVEDWAVLRDFTQGALEQTGRPLDLALESEGFFSVDVNGETQYTRDGRFTLDADGRLTTASGRPVLDDGGAEIIIDTELGPVEITPRGDVNVGGQLVSRLGVYNFEDLSALEKSGEGLFTSPVEGDLMDEPTMRQGYVERSNVSPIFEITRMIEVQRAYESVRSMVDKQEELKRRAVERLGRTS